MSVILSPWSVFGISLLKSSKVCCTCIITAWPTRGSHQTTFSFNSKRTTRRITIIIIVRPLRKKKRRRSGSGRTTTRKRGKVKICSTRPTSSTSKCVSVISFLVSTAPTRSTTAGTPSRRRPPCWRRRREKPFTLPTATTTWTVSAVTARHRTPPTSCSAVVRSVCSCSTTRKEGTNYRKKRKPLLIKTGRRVASMKKTFTKLKMSSVGREVRWHRKSCSRQSRTTTRSSPTAGV
ncbi:hypothetical protein AGDE_13566 [Angomonas deanei]|nr:hypothetical protein AGDE_13566 [Angomonas deanei]|eukprot:EPY22084.1 hypothetical protein AGDE_13566 [Angomonas deanei]